MLEGALRLVDVSISYTRPVEEAVMLEGALRHASARSGRQIELKRQSCSKEHCDTDSIAATATDRGLKRQSCSKEHCDLY